MVSNRASAEEDIKLHDYEMVLVISPEIDDEKFEATLDSVSRFITGKGGIVSDIERWGKKRLAYPVRHIVEGNYVLTRFKLQPEFGKELEANLRISEDVLRHLLVKMED